MPKLFILLLLIPITGIAHPGIGIVKDSKGTLFYTDLTHVWMISNGKKTIAVPNVHTHELYIDQADNLFGEGSSYDGPTEKFYHYLWVRRSNGEIDTAIGVKEAYRYQDFSLARDKRGNEYYLKRFLKPHTDTTRLYRKTPDGKESIYATGHFKNVNWLHPQDNGVLLYVSNYAIYKVDSLGTVRLLKASVAHAKPSFPFSGNTPTIWGLWQDSAQNTYAAVFSDQAVKKIDTAGNLTVIYTSSGNWTPLNGVFDNTNQLWVLEGSDKNEFRVTKVPTTTKTHAPTVISQYNPLIYLLICSIILIIALVYWQFNKAKARI